MFRKVLIADRGATACRIIRTLRRMRVASVAVFSEADRSSLHVEQADEAICIGPASVAESYLSVPAILGAAQRTKAEAIHPGCGLLSAGAGFAEACEAASVTFMGATPDQQKLFSLKHTARSLASESGIPLLPGTSLLADVRDALSIAPLIGYPVMLKRAGGTRVCRSADELKASFAPGTFLEKAVKHARHIEVQIFGDGHGNVVAFGERDCSAQRHNQTVIAEAPAPGLTDNLRDQLLAAALRLGKAVRYRSAGTVEFIYDEAKSRYYFLDVKACLQHDHGVTEEVTGIDLVEWMVRLAAGDVPFRPGDVIPTRGVSIQARVYAEDPAKDFQRCTGRLAEVRWPAGIHTWVESGSEVTSDYDPMLAKIIVHGEDRKKALTKLLDALSASRVSGVETNLSYLRQLADDSAFAAGAVTTDFLSTQRYQRRAIDVVAPGAQTAVQDYPGRLGYWHTGVPPSGPMDSLAFRLANRLAGNLEGAAGLEMIVTGPSLRFASDAVIAVTGADFNARLNGQPVARWAAVGVTAGSLLEFGRANDTGNRGYLAVSGGGFDLPEFLGSRSTFILGKFGGHAGRALRAGDVLHLRQDSAVYEPQLLPEGLIPQYSHHWEIGALYGPHGAPDFFTPADVDTFFATGWKVHFNSDRTGIRLIGPKPVWARKDGGEAGLHPSNIHDNAYAVGTVDFTGDMPVILGPDGPSLGGFVCPATIVQAELWKIGQLRPGDFVRFVPISQADAEQMERGLDHAVATLSGELPHLPAPNRCDPVLRSKAGVVVRADGDKYLLVEYGANVLDLRLRFRVHALERELRSEALPGIIDITPGVRSLHIHYDSRALRQDALIEALEACEKQIPDLENLSVPSRIVHLPLSWDDPATQLAIQRYTQSVRPDAPWAPSNIEFIRRINGLNSIDEVHRIVFEASYLVLGLGDVYLGAPGATPLDPRHRLVTTKYNPARTWTPENAVGIGGAYLCVYGMEGPGGYQFVGRTVQMWNSWKSTAEFEPGTPWLLRFFDQIRFYPVTAEELLEIRTAFPLGRYPLKIEQQVFRLADYQAFLASIQPEASAFKRQQQAAFEAERERWRSSGTAPMSELALPSEVSV